jgi:DUF4097 and DUF4098 domain-containing protein YvlB
VAKRAKSFRVFSVSAILFLTLLAAPILANGIEHSFDVTAGGHIRIVADGASIEVDTRPGNRASIKISRGGDSEARILRDYDIDVSQDGDTIVVEADRKRLFDGFFNWFKKSLEISIVVPERFDVDLTTSGGSIQIADLEGSVDARTSGGSLRLQAIDGPINARTSGGSITVAECTGTTHVRTSGGSIRIDNAKGAINAHTSGGSVKAFLSAQPGGNSRLTTSGGSVTVYLAEDISVDLDAKTSGGSVRTDFKVLTEGGSHSRNKIAGALNGGGPELYLRTSGGSIRVLRQ